MLSGIKTGKRKRKGIKGEGASAPSSAASASASSTCNQNQSAAEELRRSLLSGSFTSNTTTSASSSTKNSAIKSGSTVLPHERLEKSGRIQEATAKSKREDKDATIVVGMTMGASKASRAEALLAGDDDKPDAFDQNMSMDEMLTRNVMRMAKHKKQKVKNNLDSDEEEIRTQHLMFGGASSDKKKSAAKQQKEDDKVKRRVIARDIAMNDQQDAAIGRCWWWIESGKFAKHRLLSLGNHVSLVMAPLNLSLKPGLHFYLVPIKHAESLAGCEEEVWDEIQRFQTSLRRLFQNEYNKKYGVLFSETVLPTNKFTQTKMEVIPVKRKKWLDSELYFKSTLAEQADDFGTHNKPISTKGKGLRRTMPGKGFPYFFVEWDAPNQGVAQMIESSDFPQDFAADTIGGMTGADPIRFQRKRKFSSEEERQYVLEFLEKWKKYDWTEQLDA